MKCVNCGAELAPGTTVCPNCQAAQPVPNVSDMFHSDDPGQGQNMNQGTYGQNMNQGTYQGQGTYQNQGQGTYQNQGQGSSNMDGILHSDAVNTEEKTARMASGGPVVPQGKLPNGTPYLVGGICLTIFSICCCFWLATPFAITTIVFGAKTNSAVSRGLYAEAEKDLHWAKIWLLVTGCIVVAALVLNIVIMIAGSLADSTSGVYYY